MSIMASQISGNATVCPTAWSGQKQRRHGRSALLVSYTDSEALRVPRIQSRYHAEAWGQLSSHAVHAWMVTEWPPQANINYSPGNIEGVLEKKTLNTIRFQQITVTYKPLLDIFYSCRIDNLGLGIWLTKHEFNNWFPLLIFFQRTSLCIFHTLIFYIWKYVHMMHYSADHGIANNADAGELRILRIKSGYHASAWGQMPQRKSSFTHEYIHFKFNRLCTGKKTRRKRRKFFSMFFFSNFKSVKEK